MPVKQTPFTRLTNASGAAFAALLALLFPLLFFLTSYRAELAEVRTESEHSSRLLADAVSALDAGRSGQSIQRVIGMRPWSNDQEARTFFATDGRPVAHSADQVPWPTLHYVMPVSKDGVVLGSVEIERSIRAIAIDTATVALLAIVVGAVAYRIIRAMATRALRRSLALLVRERARSQRAHIELGEQRKVEAQLLSAKLLAEDASRTKSAFLANMSHEIRTPMNAVLGLTHLLLKTTLDAKQRDYANKVQAAGQHLLGIINDVLDISKIEAGKMEVEQQQVDLRNVLGEVRNLLAIQCAEKNLVLAFDCHQDVPERVLTDPTRLKQVLLNLTSNALKFTESGGISIEVRASACDSGTALLRFDVTDTGTGISESERTRLFESFQQADVSTTRKYGGTGLGLAISKQLLALMGGAIGVESSPGIGSTFWFTLPAAVVAQAHTSVAAPLTMTLPVAKVLLVEDNDINQLIACEILRDFGLDVDVAANGRVALEHMHRSHYDLVLMDLQMPVMGGLEATGEIRQRDLWRDLPVIAMTANAMDHDREACLRAGMNDFVAKPIVPDELRSTLARWLTPRNNGYTSCESRDGPSGASIFTRDISHLHAPDPNTELEITTA